MPDTACPSSLRPPDDLVAGGLANGLKYYVWNHSDPKGYCEFRLCVGVGSWVERDEQSGLAHFVEHMAFKTTSRFAHQREVIRFLEQKGAHYGHDLNASTGLFETTYKFQLPIRNGLADVSDGLAVLAEWAFEIRATAADVESERPVIREEWRTKRGAKERLKARYWRDAVAPRVAERFPIGDLDVIEKVTSSEVQAFYNNWYRPERMAVIVVGDLWNCSDPAAISAILARLQELFGRRSGRVSDMQASAGMAPMPSTEASTALTTTCAAEAPRADGSFTEQALTPPEPKLGEVALLLQDPEVTSCTASIELLHPLAVSSDDEHLKREVTRRVFLSVLERRFALLTRGGKRACPPHVLDTAVASRPLLPRLLCTSVTATLARTDDGMTEQLVYDALLFLAHELYAFAANGATQSEISHAISAWAPAFSSGRTISAEELVGDCMQHFRMSGEVPLAGPSNEMATCRAFLEHEGDISRAVGMLASSFCPLGSPGAWRILVQCGSGPKLDVGEIWSSVRRSVSSMPQSEVPSNSDDIMPAGESALETLVPSSTGPAAYDSKLIKRIGAVEITLPNGVVVCCLRRSTPKQIAMQAFLLGGSSELDEADECAMQVLDDITLAAGLGDGLDGTALIDLQSVRQTRVNTQKHLYHRGLGGSTSTGQLGLLLKLAAARLTLAETSFQREDVAVAVARARARLAEDIRQREHEPHFALGQRARILSCGGADIPVLRPVSAEAVEQLTAGRCGSLHSRAFAAAPASLTFVLVGDLPADDAELGRLLAGHLGGLPRGEDAWLPAGQPPTRLPSDFAQGVVCERLRSASAEKATVLVIFHAPVPTEDAGQPHLDTMLGIQALCRCAEDKLLARLRTEAGGVYSVSVGFGRTSLSPHGHISISFTCEPSSSDALASLAIEELRRLQDTGPSQAEATSVRQALVETHARNLSGKSANSYWLFYILDAYKGERLRCANASESEACMDTGNVETNVWAASEGRAARLEALVTTELLQQSFRRYFDIENYVHLVLEPQPSEAEKTLEGACGVAEAGAKRPKVTVD